MLTAILFHVPAPMASPVDTLTLNSAMVPAQVWPSPAAAKTFKAGDSAGDTPGPALPGPGPAQRIVISHSEYPRSRHAHAPGWEAPQCWVSRDWVSGGLETPIFQVCRARELGWGGQRRWGGGKDTFAPLFFFFFFAFLVSESSAGPPPAFYSSSCLHSLFFFASNK